MNTSFSFSWRKMAVSCEIKFMISKCECCVISTSGNSVCLFPYNYQVTTKIWILLLTRVKLLWQNGIHSESYKSR